MPAVSTGERAAFLEAIREVPEDDTPRLVYADWLDETGDFWDSQRAALIRRQIKTGEEFRLETRANGCWCSASGHSSPHLPYDLESSVIKDLNVTVPADRDGLAAVVRRGFVAEFTAPTPAFMTLAGRMFLHPATKITLPDRRCVEWSAANIGTTKSRRSWWFLSSLRPEAWTPDAISDEGISHHLPCALWDHLEGFIDDAPVCAAYMSRFYESVPAAQEALGRACLAYGKKEFANLTKGV